MPPGTDARVRLARLDGELSHDLVSLDQPLENECETLNDSDSVLVVPRRVRL
jgi:hypothetical protein